MMRFAERTLTPILIHARIGTAGATGGRARGFSPEGTAVRASVLPAGGDAKTEAYGDAYTDRVCLLVAADTCVRAGDGASIDGRMYIVRAVNRWRAHLELICEARGG